MKEYIFEILLIILAFFRVLFFCLLREGRLIMVLTDKILGFRLHRLLFGWATPTYFCVLGTTDFEASKLRLNASIRLFLMHFNMAQIAFSLTFLPSVTK